jgi:hypothetical protein
MQDTSAGSRHDNRTWDMQWKVVRRIAECLGYVRFGREHAGCKGPCFDNVLEGRDALWDGGEVIWLLDADDCIVACVLCAGRPSRAGFVEYECSSCPIANMCSWLRSSRPLWEGAKTTSPLPILQWQLRITDQIVVRNRERRAENVAGYPA